MAGPDRSGEQARSAELIVNEFDGNLVVHRPDGLPGPIASLAHHIRRQPGWTAVIVDAAGQDREALLDVLGGALAGRGPVRLFLSGAAREAEGSLAGQLATRTGQVVEAPAGLVLPVADQRIFVLDNGPGGGQNASTGHWMRLHPDAPPVRLGARYPAPRWERSVPDRARFVGQSGLMDPVPGGLWLHSNPAARSPQHRFGEQVYQLPIDDETLTIVLGAPNGGLPAFGELVDELARLGPEVLAAARLIPFGVSPEIVAALATSLDLPLRALNGMPRTTQGGRAEVCLLAADGRSGLVPYLLELRHAPGGGAAGPQPVAWRVPGGAGALLEPGVFALSPDHVVETVQSGLWVRANSRVEGSSAVQVRGALPEPERLLVWHDPASADAAARLINTLDPADRRAATMQTVAEPVGAELVGAELVGAELVGAEPVGAPPAPPAGAVVTSSTAGPVVTADPPTDADADTDARRPAARPGTDQPDSGQPEASRYDTARPDTARPDTAQPAYRSEPEPARSAAEPTQPPVAVRAVPDVALPAAPPTGGVHRPPPGSLDTAATPGDREVLRGVLGSAVTRLSGVVVGMLAASPGRRSLAGPDTALDLTAVAAFAEGALLDAFDAGGPTAAAVSRCLLSGLRQLPTHRGVVFGRLEDEVLPADGDVIASGGFEQCSTRRPAVDTLLVVRSRTARRLGALSAEPDRVVFPPGSRFEVLGVTSADDGASANNGTHAVLAREVSGTPETADDDAALRAALRDAPDPDIDPDALTWHIH